MKLCYEMVKEGRGLVGAHARFWNSACNPSLAQPKEVPKQCRVRSRRNKDRAYACVQWEHDPSKGYPRGRCDGDNLAVRLCTLIRTISSLLDANTALEGSMGKPAELFFPRPGFYFLRQREAGYCLVSAVRDFVLLDAARPAATPILACSLVPAPQSSTTGYICNVSRTIYIGMK